MIQTQTCSYYHRVDGQSYDVDDLRDKENREDDDKFS